MAKIKIPRISKTREYPNSRSNMNDGLIVFDSDVKRFEKNQEKRNKILKAKF